ncbi:MAG: chloride channel protein [Actinobacteria bacterium]|nr:chloride channel protein [Actinomycetota bacterium]
MSQGQAVEPAEPGPLRLQMRAFVLAIVIGLVAATAASLFMWVVDGGQEFVYKTLPESFGWEKLPGWWVLLLLLVGAVLVHVARRLPGATGGSPLSGFHFTNPISWAPSILLAALGTLVFGASLGPEGPLIVLGSAVAAILVKRANSDDITKLAMLLGGMAAIGTIFGNPFVAAFMLLEFAAMGAVPSAALVPAFVSLGAGYVTLVGWGSWTGFGVHVLSVPGLPAYDSLEPDDLFAGLIVAVIVSVLAALARELGERTDLLSTKRPTAVLFVAAAATAGIAWAVATAFDVSYDQILFSGQTGMAGLVAQTSASAVVAIVLGKLVVYGLALGGGFRGGPVFPATFIGVGFGVLTSLVFTNLSVSAMAAVGISAAATVMLRLPFTSGMLAMLLIGGAGPGIAPFAIIGAVVGFIVRQGLDAFDAKRQADAVPATT